MPDDRAVRPLNDQPEEPRHHAPPRFTIGAALLLIGGLLGWAASSIGAGDTAVTTTADPQLGAPTTTIVPRDPRPTPTITWAQATTMPVLAADLEYNGSSEVVELEGDLYLTINFRDPNTGEEHGEIWQSRDGLEWTSEIIDVGGPVVGLELTALDDTLLLAGLSADRLGLWRSIPGRAIGGASWTEIELEVPDQLNQAFLGTAVNSNDELMVVMIAELEIWRDIVEPHLPSGVDISDPKYVLREDGALFETWVENGQDFAETIPLFREAPEVVITGDNVWIRLVTAAGEEVLRTMPLPDATFAADTNPPLSRIPVIIAWISSDGDNFLPVTGRNALPGGFFLPEPWGDSFVTAVYEREDAFATEERVRLWTSGSGRAWRESDRQPPTVCSPFFIAVSADRIHLTSEDRTQCVRTLDSDWEVLAEPSHAAYTVGGSGGFIGYPDEFGDDTATFSRDGITWTEVEIPGPEPYPSISVLRNRLVTLSVGPTQPNLPTEVDIWRGEISS